MDNFYVLIFMLIFFVLGFLIRGLTFKTSGRFVIDEEADSFYIAITEKPENLKRHNFITLKVYINKRRKN